MNTSTPDAYLRDAVMTATPEQLQLMLYDGAIRNCMQARDAIEAKDFETSHDKLLRAQQIMSEMQSGLNYDVNRELCERVASVYNFIYRKLVDANMTRETGAIDDALRVLHMERETWQILVDKVSRIPQAESSPMTDEPPDSNEVLTSFSAEA